MLYSNHGLHVYVHMFFLNKKTNSFLNTVCQDCSKAEFNLIQGIVNSVNSIIKILYPFVDTNKVS